MPAKSSGVVSLRTKMTDSPLAAKATASSLEKTTLPTAAPGDALVPIASKRVSPVVSNRGNIK